MQFFRSAKGIALILIVLILAGVGLWYATSRGIVTLGPTTAYDGRLAAFQIPASNKVEEYSLRAIAVGTERDGTFVPLVNVTEYRQDPDAPRPDSYGAYLQVQADALCKTDIAGVKCTSTHIEAYESPTGYKGKFITYTVSRTKDDGSTEEFTYGPLYAFNMTRAASENNPLQYRVLIVGPTLSSALNGEDTVALMGQIMRTLDIKDEISKVEGPKTIVLPPSALKDLLEAGAKPAP